MPVPGGGFEHVDGTSEQRQDVDGRYTLNTGATVASCAPMRGSSFLPRCPVGNSMPEAPMPISLAAYIKSLIDWDQARNFDLAFEQIVVAFPDITEEDLGHALTTVAAELRENGRRNADQTLLDQADAFDELTVEWIEQLRSRA
jgi:hypothetical protein